MIKCLAFAIDMSSGFRTLRATESVLRKYRHFVTGGRKQSKLKTLGSFANGLKELGLGNNEVLATLEQIRDLSRIPPFHPQETLSLEEAISPFGICQSAVATMLKEIPDPPSGPLPAGP